jgi:hypothetical protein
MLFPPPLFMSFRFRCAHAVARTRGLSPVRFRRPCFKFRPWPGRRHRTDLHDIVPRGSGKGVGTSGSAQVMLSRRLSLVKTAGVGTGLTFGLHLTACSREQRQPPQLRARKRLMVQPDEPAARRPYRVPFRWRSGVVKAHFLIVSIQNNRFTIGSLDAYTSISGGFARKRRQALQRRPAERLAER